MIVRDNLAFINCMVIGSVIGSFIGSRILVGMSTNTLQIILGTVLIMSAIHMVMRKVSDRGINNEINV